MVTPVVVTSLDARSSHILWYAASKLVDAFSPQPINKDHQKRFAFSRQGQCCAFTELT